MHNSLLYCKLLFTIFTLTMTSVMAQTEILEFSFPEQTGEATITSGLFDIGLTNTNTSSFLKLVNSSGGTHYFNRVGLNPEIDQAEVPNVEIRFGQGSQKAHRFTIPEGEGGGVITDDYTYQDYVDVPFQVWDTDNDIQLMVSFRDQQNDGAFNLLEFNITDGEELNHSREYLYIHLLDYSEMANASISLAGGHEFDRMFSFWPYLTLGGTFDPDNLPNSTLAIEIASSIIEIEVEFGTDITDLTPSITMDATSTVSPESGVANDFSEPRVFKVTAEDGIAFEKYIVNVSRAISEIDIQALIDLYNATDGGNWVEPWDLDQPIETWTGITIANSRISRLDLAERNLVGTIPISIGDLTEITTLDLSKNNLTGGIPQEIGSLTKLHSLLVNDNNLTGSLPVEMGNLTELVNLWVVGNQLDGSIPTELGNLTNLLYLNAGHNNFSGTIPASLGNTNMNFMYLSNCNLTGSIPLELGNLSSLQDLRLEENNLSGRIPDEFGDLIDLRLLIINDNANLTGSIPLNLTSLSLDSFLFQNTNLCELNDETYDTWKSGVTNYQSTGLICDLGQANFLHFYLEEQSLPEESPVNDLDSNNYGTVLIGNQLWMKENLKTTTYNDGAKIVLETENSEWELLTTGAYTWYNNNNENEDSYGMLYNAYAVNTEKLCPTNWHVPTVTEWDQLANFLGGKNIAGNKLKELGNQHWASLNNTATNTSGFTGLPGGIRNPNGSFQSLGTSGNWWTSTINGEIYQWNRWLIHDNSGLVDLSNQKKYGLSVRCMLNSGGIVNSIEKSIHIEVEYGTDLESLKPNFILSSGATAEVNGQPQLSGLASLDFTNSVVYTITSEDGLASEDWTVSVTEIAPNNETDILDFNVKEQLFESIIDLNTHTVNLLVEPGTDITTLDPSITISEGASIDPTSDTPIDFTSAVTYTVIAQDGTTLQEWEVNIELGSYGIEGDSLALLSLYHSTDGANWINSWDLTQPMSTWHGITLTDGRVTSINLSANMLSGDLPNDIHNLSMLNFLYLYENELTGNIPENVAKLEHLQVLNLASNAFTGNIPTVLEKLKELTDLSLQNNQLSGSIPSNLGSLKKLYYLQLYANQLSGNIPSEIGQLTNLIVLSMDVNQLTGPIPSSIGNLTILRNFGLAQNQLTGSIPFEMGNLINLKEVSFTNNQLSGPIPSELGELINLDLLRLDQNAGLEGSVPMSLINLAITTFSIGGTSICEPTNSEFMNWKADVSSYTGSDINCPITETSFETFRFDEQSTTATIDAVNHTVETEVYFSTDLSDLIAYFTLSSGATVQVASMDQVSGTTPNDFTTPLIYTILAEDGITVQDWTVTVDLAEPRIDTEISSFTLSEQTGDAIISSGNVTIEVPYGTDVTALVPGISISDGSTVDPISGVGQDFTEPVTYTVTAEDGITTADWLVSVTIAPNTATEILSFILSEQINDATIMSGIVNIEVPFGTDVTALIPEIETSFGATIAPSSEIAQDYTESVSYTVTAEDGITSEQWIVTVTVSPPNTETELLMFTLPEETGEAIIISGIVNIEVPYGTVITSLIPEVTISDGATISPSSGSSQDFTESVIYVVTAEDGTTTQQWIVTVLIAPNMATEILTFSLTEQTGDATINDGIINIEVPFGTDVTGLAPEIETSYGATTSPSNGEAQDFTASVVYTVTAEDEITTQDWVVTVTIAPNSETAIIEFTFAEQTGPAIIDETNFTVDIEVEMETNLSSLTPAIVISEGAIITPESGTTTDFSSAVIYTVTAQDEATTQEWTVFVSQQPLGVDKRISLGIYPNPVASILTITWPELKSVKIQTLLGQVVISSNEHSVNMEGLISGIYILTLEGKNGEIETRKIIKE